MTPHQPDHPLPWTQKLSYGLPAFALAVVGIPVYVHIPKFYTDVHRRKHYLGGHHSHACQAF